MNLSVCLASYNGSQYIKLQIQSILDQLSYNDELIIVDDNSTDSTKDILDSFLDSRIVIKKNNTNLGVNKSFQIAISMAKNELIFLSDQDDIWPNGRVNIFKCYFKNNLKVDLITGNSMFINHNGEEINYSAIDGVKSNKSFCYCHNIFDILFGVTNYYGCTMAFRKRFVDKICPFPDFIESHDLHIAISANIYNVNLHIDDIILMRRIHTQNNSLYKRSIIKKIKSRIIFIMNIIHILQKKIYKNGV